MLDSYFQKELLFITYDIDPLFVKSLFAKFEKVFGNEFANVKITFSGKNASPIMKIS